MATVQEAQASMARSDRSTGFRLEAALGGALGALAAAGAALGAQAASGSGLLTAVAVGAVAALLAGWMWARVGRCMSAIDAVGRVARRLGSGGHIQRIEPESLGDLAAVGESFNRIFATLGGSSQRVLEIVARLQGLPEGLTDTMAEIHASSEAQEEAVEETASLMMNINSSIRGINERVENLSRAAEESSSAILEMGSSVDEVARNAASLHDSVENSTSSVHEMSASIRQVAGSAEQVQRMAEETAASMLEMDRTVREVGGHAQQASGLTEQVSEGAEQGSQAVAATIEDIERIHLRTSDAKQGLEQLVSRISEIAEILNVIGDINDEANLLSLNAAIIAAQAGEQGKAFLVVANHVKTLAQRTAASTKDIERLIGTVRSESDSAVHAMAAGIQVIEQGVERSRVAGDALASIRESARGSSVRVAEIARATEEQTRGSNLVARAAQETSSQIQQISQAMSEQSRASDQMLKSSELALDVCRHVHRSIEEQRETGRYITESVSSITEMIRLIQENTAVHATASDSVSDAVTRLLENARKSGQQIPEVNEMLQLLRTHSEQIVAELGRFELTGGPDAHAAEEPGALDRDAP